MGPREHMGRPGLRLDSLSWGLSQAQWPGAGLEGKQGQVVTGGGPGEAQQSSPPGSAIWMSPAVG